MKVLAIDTATERCSVVLYNEETCIERSQETARAHAELVLPMVSAVLEEAGLTMRELNGIAYGRGPGSFTGVRIAVSVVQGLAFAADLPTVGVSNLAAVAQQAARHGSSNSGDRILVCMDARMGEIYCAQFECTDSGLVVLSGIEAVLRPEALLPEAVDRCAAITVVVGTGLKAHPSLAAAWAHVRQQSDILPHAREIALLGRSALAAGEGLPAWDAQPVYIRDRVV